jgi:hypothetical protein
MLIHHHVTIVFGLNDDITIQKEDTPSAPSPFLAAIAALMFVILAVKELQQWVKCTK